MKNATIISLITLIVTVVICLLACGKFIHVVSDAQIAIQNNTLAIQAGNERTVKLEIKTAVDDAEDKAAVKANAEQHAEIKSTMEVISSDIKTLLKRGTL